MAETELTCNLRVSRRTRERLKSIGAKGETYDQIINRLIEFFLKSEKQSHRK